MFQRKITKRRFQIILAGIICFGSFSDVFCTKLTVATHTAGQCIAPGDSKAGMRLSYENGLNVDCNLQISKDGELVLSHDDISDRNFFGDLENVPIPYIVNMCDKIGDYHYEQFKDENYIRFEDYLEYIKEKAPDLILYAEVKSHNSAGQEIAVEMINEYGLADQVYLYALTMKDKDYIKNSPNGSDIKVILWVNENEELIDEALSDAHRNDFTAIAMENSISDMVRVVNKVVDGGLEVVVAGWHWEESDLKLLDATGLDITILSNEPDNTLELAPFNSILKPVIAYPDNKQSFESGETINIKTFVADNYDKYGKNAYTVTKVEFYLGDELIHSDNTSPYEFNNWKPKDGAYTIKAKVYDAGKTKFSNPINITVGN